MTEDFPDTVTEWEPAVLSLGYAILPTEQPRIWLCPNCGNPFETHTHHAIGDGLYQFECPTEPG